MGWKKMDSKLLQDTARKLFPSVPDKVINKIWIDYDGPSTLPKFSSNVALILAPYMNMERMQLAKLIVDECMNVAFRNDNNLHSDEVAEILVSTALIFAFIKNCSYCVTKDQAEKRETVSVAD